MKSSSIECQKRRISRLAILIIVSFVQGCAYFSPDRPIDVELPAALLSDAKASEGSLDYRGAADTYQKLATLAPNNIEITLSLIKNLRYAGETQQAMSIVSEALARFPKNPVLLLEMGKIQIALGRYVFAVDTLYQARDLDIGNWRVHTALGVARDCLEQYKEAQESYQVALALSQDNPEILNNMALSMAQAGDVENAVKILEQASHHPTATVQVRQNLALLKAINGDTVEAERLENQNMPAEVARHNIEYLRILAAKSRHKVVAK